MLLDKEKTFKALSKEQQGVYLYTLQVWSETRGSLETLIETEKLIKQYDPEHFDERISDLQKKFSYYNSRLEELNRHYSNQLSNKI